MLPVLALAALLQQASPAPQDLAPGTRYDPAIPTVEQVVGHLVTQEITPPDQIVRYFFDFSLMSAYWPDILRGFLITVEMSILTIVIGIPLGLALAILRLYGIRPLNWLIIFYIDFFRSIPQLVLIVLAYFALPYFGLVLEPFTATVLALAIVLSAFAEEIFWAGINAVPKGQWEAGRSTGLSFSRTLAYIILPQVVRISIPPLTNRAIGIHGATTR